MIEVRQVVADGVDEAWERVTGEPDVRGVEVGRIDFAGGWNVTVAVMEFVREDPLEASFAAGLPPHCGQSAVSGRPRRWIERRGS